MASSWLNVNIPILSIPIYYVLAVYPHGHAMTLATKGHLTSFDNRNPKGISQQEQFKKRLSPRQYAAYERGENCHRNCLENMPLFVAAVFAGLLAEQRVGTGEVGLTIFCVGWLVLRIVYVVNYLVVETVQWSYIRTLVYNAGTAWTCYILGRSAFILGD